MAKGEIQDGGAGGGKNKTAKLAAGTKCCGKGKKQGTYWDKNDT